MRLFYDTETSGLVKADLPAGHPSQPNIVQLGAKLFDAQWRCTGSLVCLIKPAGWSIEPEAEQHHGISEARCSRHGIPLVAALSAFQGFVLSARQIVAHNAEFDRKVILAELHRLGSDALWWRGKAEAFACTMELSTPILQMPGDYGNFKWPSLEEAHRFFYPELPYSTRHEAGDDIDACVRVFRGIEAAGKAPPIYSGRPSLGL